MMLRTRLVSFALGFSTAGAAISHFVWKEMWSDRSSLSSEIKHRFGALEARITELESLAYRNSDSIKDEGI
ncbi:fanconi anemia group D2 protein [Tasmannia lanceolata]|uniref:fanconi anemia group D2 protein n=1 Tax=Tasmannia lanceolata TaxID=3420 RepID=UPI00406287A5